MDEKFSLVKPDTIRNEIISPMACRGITARLKSLETVLFKIDSYDSTALYPASKRPYGFRWSFNVIYNGVQHNTYLLAMLPGTVTGMRIHPDPDKTLNGRSTPQEFVVQAAVLNVNSDGTITQNEGRTNHPIKRVSPSFALIPESLDAVSTTLRTLFEKPENILLNPKEPEGHYVTVDEPHTLAQPHPVIEILWVIPFPAGKPLGENGEGLGDRLIEIVGGEKVFTMSLSGNLIADGPYINNQRKKLAMKLNNAGYSPLHLSDQRRSA